MAKKDISIPEFSISGELLTISGVKLDDMFKVQLSYHLKNIAERLNDANDLNESLIKENQKLKDSLQKNEQTIAKETIKANSFRDTLSDLAMYFGVGSGTDKTTPQQFYKRIVDNDYIMKRTLLDKIEKTAGQNKASIITYAINFIEATGNKRKLAVYEQLKNAVEKHKQANSPDKK